MLEYLKTQGVVFHSDKQILKLIQEYFAEVSAIFPEISKNLSVVFCYDQSEQNEKAMQNSDAIFWYHTPCGEETIYAIGISVSAIAQGKEYTLLCILHEIAHMYDFRNGRHGIAFHSCLDNLIYRFNSATGKSIKNDYFGLEVRHDSRAYILPDNIPREARRTGKQFREG